MCIYIALPFRDRTFERAMHCARVALWSHRAVHARCSAARLGATWAREDARCPSDGDDGWQDARSRLVRSRERRTRMFEKYDTMDSCVLINALPVCSRSCYCAVARSATLGYCTVLESARHLLIFSPAVPRSRVSLLGYGGRVQPGYAVDNSATCLPLPKPYSFL